MRRAVKIRASGFPVPCSGRRGRQVTDTFEHDTRRLVDITVADGGRLASTAGHKFYDEWAQLPENRFATFSNVSPNDFARIAEMAIADPSVTLHINLTGLADQGTFFAAAQRGLLGGERRAAATDYEMSMIARALINGQRPWGSIKFYSPSGPGGAMRLDPPTDMPDLSRLKGDLGPVKGSIIGYCHC